MPNYPVFQPARYTDMVDLPANNTPVVANVDAIVCYIGGTVTVVTVSEQDQVNKGNTDPDGTTHAVTMVAGQQINIGCVKLTGDGTFKGAGLQF